MQQVFPIGGVIMDNQFSFSELSQQLPFTDVLDNIDVGINVYDADGNFLFVNTVMVNWRNIPRQEFLKMNVRDFYSTMDVCVFDLVRQQKQRVCRLQYYTDFQKADGITRTRIVIGTPIFDGQGNIQFVIVMLQDVGEFETLHSHLLEEHQVLREGIRLGNLNHTEIVAKSPEMLQVLASANTVAPLDSTILLYGESGSGKEVLARFIQNHSHRSDRPMITVNCAALPENLIEAELFGYAKGSFTGANREGKMGLAEAADGGTLFLDEINSLPLAFQGKVLRMIEEKSIRRVGANNTTNVDFRLIAATNPDLRTLVQEGSFREDLYYRLNVIPLIIPPLRRRQADIVPMALHFLHEYCLKYGLKKNFSDQALQQLQDYQWPGNVRELRNLVERMVVMTPSSTTDIDNLPSEFLGQTAELSDHSFSPPGRSLTGTGHRSRTKLTRERIVSALEVCQSREEAAAYLGISRRCLQYKIKEFGLSPRTQKNQGNSSQ